MVRDFKLRLHIAHDIPQIKYNHGNHAQPIPATIGSSGIVDDLLKGEKIKESRVSATHLRPEILVLLQKINLFEPVNFPEEIDQPII
jgi:hypothetical protein